MYTRNGRLCHRLFNSNLIKEDTKLRWRFLILIDVCERVMDQNRTRIWEFDDILFSSSDTSVDGTVLS